MYWTNRYYMFIHLSSNIAWFKANTIVFYTFYAPLFLFHDQFQNKPFKIMINFAGNAIMKHQNSKEKWFKLNWQNSFLHYKEKRSCLRYEYFICQDAKGKKFISVSHDFYIHVVFCVQVSFNASWEFSKNPEYYSS